MSRSNARDEPILPEKREKSISFNATVDTREAASPSKERLHPQPMDMHPHHIVDALRSHTMNKIQPRMSKRQLNRELSWASISTLRKKNQVGIFTILRHEVQSEGSIYNNTIMIVILISCVSFLLETEPYLKTRFNWGLMETVCVLIFTAEYIIKLVVAKHKWKVACTVMSMIDLAAILPFYITAIFASETSFNLAWIRAIRLIRVVRVVKLGHFSSSVRVFGTALQSSFPHLFGLVLMMLIGNIIFSSALYYAEGSFSDGEDIESSIHQFKSIPDTLWWGFVTMTTVGYGDRVPMTPMGKAIAVACMLTGLLIFSLPVTVIGDNFARAVKQDEVKKFERNLLHKSIMNAMGSYEFQHDKGISEADLNNIVKAGCRTSSIQQSMLSKTGLAFMKYDKDDSGYLDPSEIQHMVKDILDKMNDFGTTFEGEHTHLSAKDLMLLDEIDARIDSHPRWDQLKTLESNVTDLNKKMDMLMQHVLPKEVYTKETYTRETYIHPLYPGAAGALATEKVGIKSPSGYSDEGSDVGLSC